MLFACIYIVLSGKLHKKLVKVTALENLMAGEKEGDFILYSLLYFLNTEPCKVCKSVYLYV